MDGEVTGESVNEQLAGLWNEVLGYQVDISPDSDFFALGGHSLMVLRLCDEANAHFGSDLRPEDVFFNADFASMVRAVEATR